VRIFSLSILTDNIEDCSGGSEYSSIYWFAGVSIM
jgi:hypothetical protein